MEKGISPNALWRLGDSGIVWIGEVFGFLISPESEQIATLKILFFLKQFRPLQSQLRSSTSDAKLCSIY